MIDRRRSERFKVKLSACVSICGSKRTDTPAFMTTRDVSTRGAYLATPEPLPVGTRVDVDLILKVGDQGSAGAKNAWIKASGAVCRTDSSGMVVHFDEDSKLLPFSVGVPIQDPP